MAILKTAFHKLTITTFTAVSLYFGIALSQETNDGTLQDVVIVTRDKRTGSTKIAAQVLAEEIEKRTGLKWLITAKSPARVNKIILSIDNDATGCTTKPESYHLQKAAKEGACEIHISGADRRGLLFGVGKFLRMMEWRKGAVRFANNVDISSSPVYPIRGHQLGYRATANSYDAWTPEMYDQYIRELALFGTNSIENIPLHPGSEWLMKISPEAMNITMSAICDKYDLDYWVWTPATFDLSVKAEKDKAVAQHIQLYHACPRLNGVFFPGGDPGENHPKYIMPFLEELSHHLLQNHPNAKVWLSMQSFDEEEIDFVFKYLDKNKPDWFGGLVSGPGSPPMPDSRKRLCPNYQLRHYPDLTHSTRCQYPVSWWDPALARTLGRECPNPQPVYSSLIHNWFAPFTDGFISYSDGMHDDVNKIIWSAKGWDPNVEIREVLKDYARFFFRPDLAESAADGILGLENNWKGALVHNGSVESTLNFWRDMAAKAPELDANWRWQLCQLRSHYDAYIRRRVIYERQLEDRVNALLAQSPQIGADRAMEQSQEILHLALTAPAAADLRIHIEEIALSLYTIIGFQTSVKKYHASGLNRGAIIDFLDLPMNNRLWLEDEFAKIKTLSSEQEKIDRLEVIQKWETPGDGSFYDDVGTLDRSTHLVRGEGLETDPLMERNPNPGIWIWEDGFSRLRLSWLVSMDRPVAMVYENLDPSAAYDVRVTGYFVDKIQMNGEWVEPFVWSDEKGAMVEYHVPAKAIKTGKLVLNWGHTEMTEVWLIKK